MKKKTRKQGFTLVEVMVVMAIVALLAATAIPKIKGIYDEAQLDKAVADAMQIVAAIQRVELKNELSRTSSDVFSASKVLEESDFDSLSVTVKPGSYTFRYCPAGELEGNASSRGIQIYKGAYDSDSNPIKEVIIPE